MLAQSIIPKSTTRSVSESAPWETLNVLTSTATTSLTSATATTKTLSSVIFVKTTMLAQSIIPKSTTRSVSESAPWEILNVLTSTMTTSLTSATATTKTLSSVIFVKTTMLAP